jgi:hypothetical protein
MSSGNRPAFGPEVAARKALSAEQFVVSLLRETITCERVAAVMARIAGERIEVGPLRMGPGGAVTALGAGVIGDIKVTPVPGPVLGFEAVVPGALTIDLSAGSNGRVHRYLGEVLVPMRIQTLLEAPAWVVLDVAALRPADVSVQLQTAGVATFVLQTLGDADREVAAQVAHVVNDRVADVAELRRIDLVDLLDRAWDEGLEARLSR